MKITKAELRKIIEEELTKEAINPGGLTASAMPDPEEGSVDDQDEAKKAADEIRDLATDLERELDGELKEKATAIIDLVNTRL